MNFKRKKITSKCFISLLLKRICNWIPYYFNERYIAGIDYIPLSYLCSSHQDPTVEKGIIPGHGDDVLLEKEFRNSDFQ